jgi:hypothetical protein
VLAVALAGLTAVGLRRRVPRLLLRLARGQLPSYPRGRRTMFRRRRARREPTVTEELRVSVLAVDVDDGGRGHAERAAARERAWRELRTIVAEAVIWQDAAEEVLLAISRREPLAELAPRGGPLVRRFCELRARLPESDDVELRRITEALGPVLDHHALMLSSSLDMLAVDWRSERLVEELERIDGLGPPAERLEGIYATLAASAEPDRA